MATDPSYPFTSRSHSSPKFESSALNHPRIHQRLNWDDRMLAYKTLRLCGPLLPPNLILFQHTLPPRPPTLAETAHLRMFVPSPSAAHHICLSAIQANIFFHIQPLLLDYDQAQDISATERLSAIIREQCCSLTRQSASAMAA